MDLHHLTGLGQGAAIRRGDVTAVELAEHYLQRTMERNPSVGAFIEITGELALEQARAADEAVRSAGADDHLPPLLGVVVPIKDLNQVKGVRCRFGSAVVDVVSPVDDAVVAMLRAAGAVFTGKTSAPEFGLPAYTEPDVGPWARSPWDLTRSAGGSSGGAAAAVAAGMAPVAQGSDGGGSIRIPASACGLVGLKTSRGLVPSGPLPEGLGRLAVDGPLARTVADAAALLDAMTGRSGADAHLRALDGEPGPLLIGRYCQPVIADVAVHPECLAAYEGMSALLEALGHRLVDIDVPFPLSAVPHFERVWAAGAASIPIDLAHEDRLRPLTRWLRERGRAMSFEEVMVEVDRMAETGRAMVASTAHLDAILTPTLATLPAPLGHLRDDADPAADFEAQKAFTPFTSPYNISGQPAVSLPVHWTDEGLPVGVQLVGRPMGDAALLRLAAQVERAQPWAHRYPEVW
ncbi:MAG: amidase [Actinomycetota bacterium]|nr:amidase [Actinomycetota bacterium]